MYFALFYLCFSGENQQKKTQKCISSPYPPEFLSGISLFLPILPMYSKIMISLHGNCLYTYHI